MATRTLKDTLASIRSKNAGPFTVCFDLFFKGPEEYEEVVASKVINAETVASLYNLDPSEVGVHEFAPASAIKVAIPRLVPGGAPGDTDVAGGQQFVPLLSLTLG
jgi:hypothetical protein